MSGPRVIGVLRRADLVRGLKAGGSKAFVEDYMCLKFNVIHSEDPLNSALAEMQAGDCATLPVMDDRRLVGLLTLENIGELMMVHSSDGNDSSLRREPFCDGVPVSR